MQDRGVLWHRVAFLTSPVFSPADEVCYGRVDERASNCFGLATPYFGVKFIATARRRLFEQANFDLIVFYLGKAFIC